ncbi:MAG: hypothetical protein GXP31_18060 [Kiritimatiellaeota bacterium]|nr:hypothetical protein [Kiritimatiellota bacterium]
MTRDPVLEAARRLAHDLHKVVAVYPEDWNTDSKHLDIRSCGRAADALKELTTRLRTQPYETESLLAVPPWWAVGVADREELEKFIKASPMPFAHISLLGSLVARMSEKKQEDDQGWPAVIPIDAKFRQFYNGFYFEDKLTSRHTRCSVRRLLGLWCPCKPWLFILELDKPRLPAVVEIPLIGKTLNQVLPYERLPEVASNRVLPLPAKRYTFGQLAKLLRRYGVPAHVIPPLDAEPLVIAAPRDSVTAGVLVQAIVAASMRAWKRDKNGLVLTKIALPRRIYINKRIIQRYQALASELFQGASSRDPFVRWAVSHAGKLVDLREMPPKLQKLFVTAVDQSARPPSSVGVTIGIRLKVTTGGSDEEADKDAIWNEFLCDYGYHACIEPIILRHVGGPHAYFLAQVREQEKSLPNGGKGAE